MPLPNCGKSGPGIRYALSVVMMEIDPVKVARPLAVITRAADSVGLDLAKKFADQGYDLLITAESAEIAEAEQVLEYRGVEVESLRVDLSDYDGVEALLRSIQRLGTPVDALAIIMETDGDSMHIPSLNDELNMLQKNLLATVHLTKRIVTDMVIRGEGQILIGSIPPAPNPGPLDAVYTASNAFIHSFIETLQSELEGSGVSIAALDTQVDAATDTKGPSYENRYGNQTQTHAPS